MPTRSSGQAFEQLGPGKSELHKLGRLSTWKWRASRRGRTEGGLTVESRTIEHGWRSRA
jgi:hypothetical protein